MKYTCTEQVNLPISQVVKIWTDEQYFKNWQDGYLRTEIISGRPGEVGSKAKIYFDDGRRKMELLETILVNDLPNEKTALYEHKHMTNTQTTRFIALSDNQTQYISEVQYTEFNGSIPKLMAKLLPDVFRKQSLKWMIQFKVFAETEYNK